MKRVAVLTVGRSDYGIYRPVLSKLAESRSLDPVIIVSGSHLLPGFGETANEIERDGFRIGARVDMLLASDAPEAISKSMGLGIIGLSQAYEALNPDLLLVLGDRFEMMAGALAAVPFRIPLAHIHGGELSQGAIDDAMRHCITKLSHVHFVSSEDAALRVIQLGEEPTRVHVTGAPGLDGIKNFKPLSRSEFAARYSVTLPSSFLLTTFHPTTLRSDCGFGQVRDALAEIGMPVLITMPNEDSGGAIIRREIQEEVCRRDTWFAVDSLGTEGYFTAMHYAAAMVGNSSSGIIEAMSFGLPVVNIGDRQRGRLRGPNVVDVENDAGQIAQGIRKATSEAFRMALEGVPNPYGNGTAAEKITRVIESTSLPGLIYKSFHDMEGR